MNSKFSFFLLAIYSSLTLATDVIIKDLPSANKHINISGKDGRHGSNGHHGRDADPSSDSSTYRWAEDGGDGYDGENGENGKNILFIYDSIQQLKAFTIISQGGKGGNGGDGGNGGAPNGSRGDSGKHGKDGQDGSIYTLPSYIDYKPDSLKLNFLLKETIHKSYTLRKNIWETNDNAKELVNSQSIINNKYYSYLEQKKINVVFTIDKDVNEEDYKDAKVEIKFDGEHTKVSFPGSFVDFEVTENNNSVYVTIKSIIDIKSYTKFENVKVKGYGKELRVLFSNKGGVLDHQDLKVKFDLSRPMFFSYSTLKGIYTLENAKDYLTTNEDQAILNIGQTDLAKKYKRKGRKTSFFINFEVTIYNKPVKFGLSFNHKIGSNKVKNVYTYFREL